MQDFITRFFKGMGIAILIATLAGCVTTVTGSNTKVDKEKALASYVQLILNDIRNKNYTLARLHIKKAEALDKDAPGLLNGRALLHQYEGEPKLAEQYFKQALKEDKYFSQARNNYATFLYAQKRFEEAKEQFEIVSRDVDYKRRAWSVLGLGQSAKQLGNTARAQSAFEQALALQPRMAQAMVELAEIHFDNKEYAESKKYLEAYNKASRQSPRTLWLGIRIERIFGNKDKEASQALVLKNLYPYSKEYLEYQRVVKQEQ